MNLSSGYPYWLLRYGLPFDYAPLTQNLKTEVDILGGGISGALAAWYLIKAGVSCVVIDCRTIGLGSTSASTSLLQYELDVPLCRLRHKIGLKNAVNAYQLCAKSIDSLELISQEIGFPQFERSNSLYYARFKKEYPFISEEYNIRKDNGFDVTLMNEKEVKEYAGFNAAAAILSTKAAQTNAYSFTHALHQYSISKGVLVFDRTFGKKIDHQKNGVTITTDKGYKVRSKILLYANGYEAVNYIDKKIVNLHNTYAVCSEQGNASGNTFSS